MTDDGEQVDPRYDPAFQRGFSGGVDRLRGDERAFARPGTGAATAGSPPGAAVAPDSASAPPHLVRPDSSAVPRRILPLPDIAGAAAGRRSHRIGAETASVPLPEPEDPGQQAPAEPAREAPLLRNPWLLVLLLAGLAGSAIGLALLYTGYSSPPRRTTATPTCPRRRGSSGSSSTTPASRCWAACRRRCSSRSEWPRCAGAASSCAPGRRCRARPRSYSRPALTLRSRRRAGPAGR